MRLHCKTFLGDASLTGLTNGSTAQNIGSLVNLSGPQPMVSQPVASAIPAAGGAHPLIGNIRLIFFTLFTLLSLNRHC